MTDRDDEQLDGGATTPAEALAAIRASQEAVRGQTRPDSTRMFVVWGVAYLVAYVALYLGFDREGQTPGGWSLAVLGVSVVAAMAYTAVHITRRTSGIRGSSAMVGRMFGWAWVLGFGFAAVIVGSVAAAGAPPLAVSILANAVFLLVVAALYMAGGALWREWPMFVLGAWFAVTGAVAAIVTPPNGYLVQAVAGGGGFLVAALATALLARREA